MRDGEGREAASLSSCILLRRLSEFQHWVYPYLRAPPIAQLKSKPLEQAAVDVEQVKRVNSRMLRKYWEQFDILF